MNQRGWSQIRQRLMLVAGLASGYASGGAAQAACGNGRSPFGDLGIGLYQCVRANCVLSGRGSTDSAHVFGVEPTLWHLTAPAQGRLHDGDALVAVDGRPITTRAAGARVAMIHPGERAVLTVRRGGTETLVSLEAVPACERPSIQITSEQGESPSAAARNALRGIAGGRGALPADPRSATLPIEYLDAAARARTLGISEVTSVDSVAPGSIAGRAGVQRGDVVLAVATRGRGPDAVIRIEVRRAGRTLALFAPIAGSP